jgi:hypothetical protein
MGPFTLLLADGRTDEANRCNHPVAAVNSAKYVLNSSIPERFMTRYFLYLILFVVMIIKQFILTVAFKGRYASLQMMKQRKTIPQTTLMPGGVGVNVKY